MKRLTKRWGDEPYPNLAGRVVCEYKECGSAESCNDCVRGRIAQRLAAIEDILCDGTDDYDLERLAVMCNQRMSMRDEVSERFSLTAKIPLDRLREVAEAERDGRCVVLPCKKGDTVWRIVYDSKPHIKKDRCTSIKVENKEVWVNLIGDRVMGGWNFGKLLFLNEKEAEATLKAREQE